MKTSHDNLSILAGFLFLSNLLGIGFVITLSFNPEVSFGEFEVAVLAATCVGLLSCVVFLFHRRRTDATALVAVRYVMHDQSQPHKLLRYLSNATLLASGVFAMLAVVSGQIVFDFELGHSISEDLASFYNWLSPLLLMFAVTMTWFYFIAFLLWLINQDRWTGDPFNQKRRVEAAQYRRQLARERAEANRIAQLNKPDFSERLSQYVANVDHDSEHPPRDVNEPFVSRAKFWQCEPFHVRTLPKPIEFIRRILHRIAKAVHGT